MRNLKKILALVLALVMSLSLMATAGAAETAPTDSANAYATAEKVLEGLSVFKGDLGTGAMRYDSNVMRSEAAALLYRIMTGDVKEEQAKLYGNKNFTDGVTGHWAEGPIAYCYNAEIIKGVNTAHTLFDPNGNVTGYQLLAMALRALGYGKNGEFEGDEWIVQTAATAEREGLLKGVTPSDSLTLREPATRGLVAQILLNTLLHKTVKFSALNPYNYELEATTLGEQRLDLKYEENVVVIANQWANLLDGYAPLSAGKVRIQSADGTSRLIDWSAADKETGGTYAEGLEDLGESRDVYTQKTKVLALANSGNNVTAFNEGKKITTGDLAKTKGIATPNRNTTWFYRNYDVDYTTTAKMRIEIRLEISPNAFYSATNTTGKFTVPQTTVVNALGNPTSESTPNLLVYETVIRPNVTVTVSQQAVLAEIFAIADSKDDNTYKIHGRVTVGTDSSELNDKSNTMTYTQFMDEYTSKVDGTYTGANNGEYLKVIDNDADGVAEYVMKVEYWLDQIVETANDTYYYRDLNVKDWTVVTIEGYTEAVGDIVLCTRIDGKAYVKLAKSMPLTFKTINYRNETATDTDGTEWGQSLIFNRTTLPDRILDLSEQTSYTVYFDDFDFIRAYNNKVNYALLTEVQAGGTMNQAWLRTGSMTAEVTPVGGTTQEVTVLNATFDGVRVNNPFYYEAGWQYPGISTSRLLNPVSTSASSHTTNHLWPASHGTALANTSGRATPSLGTAFGLTTNGAANERYTSSHVANGALFNNASWTNVAKYTEGEGGMSLYSAATTAGNVTTDYVRLAVPATNYNITSSTGLFTIDDTLYGVTNEATTAANRYVRATDQTVFFVVTLDNLGTARAIRQFTGYGSLVRLNAATNKIRSMYAVAHYNNSTNVDNNKVWVGDVIVIEMYEDNTYDSIALIYSNNYKTTGEVWAVDAIDSKLGKITIVPEYYSSWNGQFTNYSNYGFYGLNNVQPKADGTYSAEIHLIDGITAVGGLSNNSYVRHGIYYGQVRSFVELDNTADYITVDVLNQYGVVEATRAITVPKGSSWGIKDNRDNYTNTAQNVLVSDNITTTTNNTLEVGDKVIWVEGTGITNVGDGTNTSTSGVGGSSNLNDRAASFMVVLANSYTRAPRVGVTRAWNPYPAFLGQFNGDGVATSGIALRIGREQKNTEVDLLTMTFNMAANETATVLYPYTLTASGITNSIAHTVTKSVNGLQGTLNLYVAAPAVGGTVKFIWQGSSAPAVTLAESEWTPTWTAISSTQWEVTLTKNTATTTLSLFDKTADMVNVSELWLASKTGWTAFLTKVVDALVYGNVDDETVKGYNDVLQAVAGNDVNVTPAKDTNFDTDTNIQLAQIIKAYPEDKVPESLKDAATLDNLTDEVESEVTGEETDTTGFTVTFEVSGAIVTVGSGDTDKIIGTEAGTAATGTVKVAAENEGLTFTVASATGYGTPVVKVDGTEKTPTEGTTYATGKIEKNITVEVTAEEDDGLTAVEVVVNKAVIQDSVSNAVLTGLLEISGQNAVTATGGALTLTTAKGMPIHKNRDTTARDGAWVGFEVALATVGDWNYVSYEKDGVKGKKSLETGLSGGSGSGIAFYFDASQTKYATGTQTVKVQFTVDDPDTATVKSKELTFTVDLTGCYVMGAKAGDLYTISKANIVDSENKVTADITAAGMDVVLEGATIKITTLQDHPMPAHKSTGADGGNEAKPWVGCQFVLPVGELIATGDSAKWTHVKFTMQGKAAKTVALEKLTETTSGIAFYWPAPVAAGDESSIVLTIQFLAGTVDTSAGTGSIATAEQTYTVDLSGAKGAAAQA